MRNESRVNNNVEIATIDQYHGGNFHGEQYAFEGFERNLYFTSDRPDVLNQDMERKNGQPLKGFGTEQEVECWSIKTDTVLAEVMKKAVFPLFPKDLFKMQHDGSLGGHGAIGVECISQIMTKAFIRNHYKDFKTMYDVYFPAFDISAARTGNCGMHVNISNALFGNTRQKQIEAIRKLHYIINKYYTFSCKLLKRKGSTTFCGRMPYENAKTMTIGGGDHYHCMNYSHFNSGRIELRLVGGQANYYEYRNTMEVVFFLVDRVKTISWADCESIEKIFKGCNQYVVKRLRDCDLPVETLTAIRDNMITEDLELH